jgi:hypothetical protein
MAIETSSSNNGNHVALPVSEPAMTIRLSFEVRSIQEEERLVTLLIFAGIHDITSVVVNSYGGATNGDSPAPRA